MPKICEEGGEELAELIQEDENGVEDDGLLKLAYGECGLEQA